MKKKFRKRIALLLIASLFLTFAQPAFASGGGGALAVQYLDHPTEISIMGKNIGDLSQDREGTLSGGKNEPNGKYKWDAATNTLIMENMTFQEDLPDDAVVTPRTYLHIVGGKDTPGKKVMTKKVTVQFIGTNECQCGHNLDPAQQFKNNGIYAENVENLDLILGKPGHNGDGSLFLGNVNEAIVKTSPGGPPGELRIVNGYDHPGGDWATILLIANKGIISDGDLYMERIGNESYVKVKEGNALRAEQNDIQVINCGKMELSGPGNVVQAGKNILVQDSDLNGENRKGTGNDRKGSIFFAEKGSISYVSSGGEFKGAQGVFTAPATTTGNGNVTVEYGTYELLVSGTDLAVIKAGGNVTVGYITLSAPAPSKLVDCGGDFLGKAMNDVLRTLSLVSQTKDKVMELKAGGTVKIQGIMETNYDTRIESGGDFTLDLKTPHVPAHGNLMIYEGTTEMVSGGNMTVNNMRSRGVGKLLFKAKKDITVEPAETILNLIGVHSEEGKINAVMSIDEGNIDDSIIHLVPYQEGILESDFGFTAGNGTIELSLGWTDDVQTGPLISRRVSDLEPAGDPGPGITLCQPTRLKDAKIAYTPWILENGKYVSYTFTVPLDTPLGRYGKTENLSLKNDTPVTLGAETDGDYTEVERALAEAEALKKHKDLYKNFNLLTEAVNRAKDNMDMDITMQDEIDALAEGIYDVIDHQLVYKDADYTAVNRAIERAEALNKELYKDFTEVEAAIDAVDQTLNITRQAEVDAYATAINTAIDNLEYKDADYDEVEEAIRKAKSLDRDKYTNYYIVSRAINQVDWDKNILAQEEVDQYAEDIYDAIDQLNVRRDYPVPPKPAEPAVPETSPLKIKVTTPEAGVTPKAEAISVPLLSEVEDQIAGIKLIGGKDCAAKITASVKGVPKTGFLQPMTVQISLSSDDLKGVTDRSHLTLARVAKDTNGKVTLEYMGGKYNPSTGEFTARVDEAGNYILVEKDNLTKIVLSIGDTDTLLNDRLKTIDVAPFIVDGRTMVPLRYVGESLGCDVHWDETTGSVTVTDQGTVLEMSLGTEIPGYGQPPVLRNDRTFVPIRYVSESLGANVIYDPSEQEIIIVK